MCPVPVSSVLCTVCCVLCTVYCVLCTVYCVRFPVSCVRAICMNMQTSNLQRYTASYCIVVPLASAALFFCRYYYILPWNLVTTNTDLATCSLFEQTILLGINYLNKLHGTVHVLASELWNKHFVPRLMYGWEFLLRSIYLARLACMF